MQNNKNHNTLNYAAVLINSYHLKNKKPRTLLLGCDINNATIHVYLDVYLELYFRCYYPKELNKPVPNELISSENIYPELFTDNVNHYFREYCDEEFIELLDKKYNIKLKFRDYIEYGYFGKT